MQLYRGNASSFIETTKQNQIALKLKEAYFNHFGFYPSVNEEMSWRNSLRAIKDVFADCGFNEQGVALEYFLPSTSLRLDCMITGKDKDNRDSAVIIELKQWQSIKRFDSENEVVTRLAEGVKELLHPSFQVNRYKEYFKELYEVFYKDNPINLTACSYLHNYSYEENDPILDKKFEEMLDKTPVFSLDEFDDIKDYIF